MSEHFGTEFFSENRRQLRNLFKGTAPIVLTAHGQLQSSADMTFPFRQDRNFWYLTGLNEPDVVLVMDKGREYLILPEHFTWRSHFEGTQNIESIAKVSGIEAVLEDKIGWKQLNSRLKKVKHIATLAPPPAFVAGHGFYTNPARARLQERIKEVNSEIELLDLKQHLIALRMVKQAQEIEAVKRAIEITEKSVKAIVRKTWSEQATESDMEMQLLQSFRQNGADNVAFDSVIAAGKHATIAHWHPGKDVLPKKGFIFFDVGAEVDNYAADITRTYSIGKPTRRMQQVYEAVVEAQEYAVNLIKPGVIMAEYEEEMERFMGEKLRALGLIKTIDHKEVRRFFPHYTSHHLGLDVHDAADDRAPLKPNMIVTVEPGIYIPEESLGVRIEDDVLVTESGVEILTAGLSRELKSLTIS